MISFSLEGEVVQLEGARSKEGRLRPPLHILKISKHIASELKRGKDHRCLLHFSPNSPNQNKGRKRRSYWTPY